VADVEVVWQPAKVIRRDRLKTVSVRCDVTEETTPIKVSGIMDEWLAGEKATWDVGYKYSLGGELESSVQANESIMVKLPIAGLIIVILLVIQFNSIRKPVIILTTIPLGLIGVVIGLLVARSYFGFMTLLGIVSLAGIVINNAIVLLDRIKIEIDERGLEPARAVVEATQRRLRPILLTTATTIGGLIPLWIGGGPMWETMAIAIIFGLAFATALTLGVVPVLYSVFYRVKFKDFRY
jgi:multidrug efflux pump subunit AcrB